MFEDFGLEFSEFDLMIDAMETFKRDLVNFMYLENVKSGEYMGGVTLDNVGTVLCVLCDCIIFCERRYITNPIHVVCYLYTILENIDAYYKHYKEIHKKEDLEFALNKVLEVIKNY